MLHADTDPRSVAPSLEVEVGRLPRWLSLLWWGARRPFLRRRTTRPVLEWLDGQPLLVLPEVLNPVLFRSGAFLARSLADLAPPPAAGARLLDMGTGSGVAAVLGARLGYRVVGVDINQQAVRCARINALLQQVEDRAEFRQGDLFEPVAGDSFDLVLFNPPFFRGEPSTPYDRAWRATDVLERFAAGLPAALGEGGSCLLLLSTDGSAAGMLRALADEGLAVEVARRRHFGNEIMTIYRVRRRS